MGFLSDVWDGVKSAFSEVGKGIKGVFKGVGKAVGEMGIIGQIGLAFILPGIGGMLGGLLSQGMGAIGSAVSGMASSGGLTGAIGKTLQVAGKFASTAGNAYKTVTDGVSSFVSKIGKGMINNVSKKLGGEALVGGPETISEGFSSWMQGVSEDIQGITSPFSEASRMTAEEVSTNYLDSIDKPIERVVEGPGSPGIRPSDTAAPSPGDPIRSVDAQKLAQSSQVTVPRAPDFSVDNQPYRFKQEDLAFEGSGAGVVQGLETKENTGLMDYVKKFVGDTVDNTMTAASEMPGRAIDTAGKQAASSITQRGMQEVGLGPEQEITQQQITNVIPSFDFEPIDMSYQQAGINYGGLPSNRLEYYAFDNQAQGDFGSSSFQAFSQFRPR